jgi:transcription antitermination factor NusG
LERLIDEALKRMGNMKGWYVAYCKQGEDGVAVNNLIKQEFDVYRPLIYRTPQGKPQSLFPRYIFFRAKDGLTPNFIAVNNTRGVISHIKFGPYAPIISEETIEVIRFQEREAHTHCRNIESLNRGDTIEIDLDGNVLIGTFYEYSSAQRVRILLNILGQNAECAIDLNRVKKKIVKNM